MESLEQVSRFCAQQSSIRRALGNFTDWFLDNYEDEDRTEQEILNQCVQQMFRKYYYSALDPQTRFTPARIVNTLIEREFGSGLMTIPVLDCTFKGKKISRLDYRFICLTADNHPMVHDMMFFLETAGTGIRMDAPGIPSSLEYVKFQKHIRIFDRHYINILCLIALEAGYLECVATENQLVGSTVAGAEEFFSSNNEAKLQQLVESTVSLCSRTLTQAFPELRKEFTVMRLLRFLRNPGSFDTCMMSIFQKMGVDLYQMDLANLDAILHSLGANEENMVRLFGLQRMLDIYFFTPCGYYLQLIQPVYPEIYDLGREMDELLLDPEDFGAIRNKLFSMAMDYDLTALGETVWGKSQNARSKRAISAKLTDKELCQIVLDSTNYLDLENEGIDFSKDETGGFAENDEADPDREQANPQEKLGKVIPFPVSKSIQAVHQANDQVFVFKVKQYDAKRVWRKIEIRGEQSLHDLHCAIFEAFHFDKEHLYAFFLSNRWWDRSTEYIHPEGKGRPAAQALIGRLDLALKQKIAYVFDFGDEHRYEVELVAVHEVESEVKYPREIKRS